MNLKVIESIFRIPNIIDAMPYKKASHLAASKSLRRQRVLDRLKGLGEIKQSVLIELCSELGEESSIRRDIRSMVKKGMIMVDTSVHNSFRIEAA